MWLELKEMKEEPKITKGIFGHSKVGGHFSRSFQISFSSIPTIEATVLKNFLIIVELSVPSQTIFKNLSTSRFSIFYSDNNVFICCFIWLHGNHSQWCI